MRLTFGSFVFDSRLRSVTRDGAPVELSPKAFQLLEALIETRPTPVAKDILYDRLWPKTFVEAGNLHNLISELRRALDDRDHQIVRTMHGVGYAFQSPSSEAMSSSRFMIWIGDEAVYLRNGEGIIGRDPEAAVVIDSPHVSRQHARILVNDDHVVIEDLGSKNGTFVGNERIEGPHVLHDGDQISLGKTVLLLRRRGSVQSTAPLA